MPTERALLPGRIRIVSDGQPRTTRIFDADSGEEVARGSIRSITWHVAAGSAIATATVEYVDVAVDVIGLGEAIEHHRTEPWLSSAT